MTPSGRSRNWTLLPLTSTGTGAVPGAARVTRTWAASGFACQCRVTVPVPVSDLRSHTGGSGVTATVPGRDGGLPSAVANTPYWTSLAAGAPESAHPVPVPSCTAVPSPGAAGARPVVRATA